MWCAVVKHPVLHKWKFPATSPAPSQDTQALLQHHTAKTDTSGLDWPQHNSTDLRVSSQRLTHSSALTPADCQTSTRGQIGVISTDLWCSDGFWVLQEANCKAHRASKVIILGNLKMLLTSGVSRWNERQIALWDQVRATQEVSLKVNLLDVVIRLSAALHTFNQRMEPEQASSHGITWPRFRWREDTWAASPALRPVTERDHSLPQSTENKEKQTVSLFIL